MSVSPNIVWISCRLKGLAYGSVCTLSDPSLVDLGNNSAVVRVAKGAAKIVPFYPLDAKLRNGIVQFVPPSATPLVKARAFHPLEKPPLSVDDDHYTIWDNRFGQSSRNDKGFLVGCAVLAGLDCAFLTPPASQEMDADSD